MKKIVFCLAMLVSMFAVSCSTSAEKSIKELEEIVVAAESGEIDTEREFEEVLQRVELLNEKYKDVEYTPEQEDEIYALNLRLSAALTEQFTGFLGRSFSGMMNGMVGGMKGFVNGMQELVDDVQELADEIEDM